MIMSSGAMPYLLVSRSYDRRATASLRLRLELVFVDRSHDEGRAIAPGDGTDQLELLLAILQVDGIDNALALAVGQREFQRARIGGVDHDGRLDLADQLVIERRDVAQFVAIRAL